MAINLAPALAKHASPMDLGRSHNGASHEERSKPASGQDQHVLPPLDHKEGGAATTPCLLQQALALRLGLGRKRYRLNYSGCARTSPACGGTRLEAGPSSLATSHAPGLSLRTHDSIKKSYNILTLKHLCALR